MASLYVHVVLGLSDGSTHGGHLMAGTVRPTLEVVLTHTPTQAQEETGNRYSAYRYYCIELVTKVETGWATTLSSQIRRQLDTVVSPKSKLTKQVKKSKAI